MGQMKVVRDFKYKGRRCVVILISRLPGLPDVSDVSSDSIRGYLEPYCNGYVELKDSEVKEDYDDYNIESDELTYHGKLCFSELKVDDGKTYIGFDSVHHWNNMNLESKTAEFVANTCKKIVVELHKKQLGGK